MLIDLDLAKQVGSGRLDARHQTGTMEFMVTEAVRKATHTFRHDLESFFHLLLWICARRVWERGVPLRPKVKTIQGCLATVIHGFVQ